MITKGFSNSMDWESNLLGDCYILNRTRVSTVTHLGYVEDNFRITSIALYKQDILMLVTNYSKYGEGVPVQLGSTVIDKAMGIITPQELYRTSKTWRHTHLSVAVKKVGASRIDKSFRMNNVFGCVSIAKFIIVPSFKTIEIKGNTRLKDHSLRVCVMVEPLIRILLWPVLILSSNQAHLRQQCAYGMS